ASQVPGLGRRVPPIVVEAVEVGHRRGEQLGRVEVVEGGDVDRDVGAVVPLGRVDEAVRPGAAVLAEAAVPDLGARAVVAQLLLAPAGAEVGDRDLHAPPAPLPAAGAVALAGALREVDVGLELDPLADAAAAVGALGGGGCRFRGRVAHGQDLSRG